MALLRIVNDIEKKSDAKLIEKAAHIHQQVSSRSAVFTTPRPTMAVLLDTIEEFRAAVTAAQTRDTVLVGQKNVVRQTLVNLLHSLSYYVLYVADGDRQVALSSGFTLAKEEGTPNVVGKPALPKVKPGLNSGELKMQVKRVPGAKSYQHLYTEDPTLENQFWMTDPCTATGCTIKGLTPGKVYHLKVGAVGSRGQLVWSDVVTQMSL